MLLGVTIQASPAAAAQPPTCGSQIRIDTTLTANVGPCTRGITIVNDNVTLDLNGFGIIGRQGRMDEGAGILIAGRRNVTVKNGRITFWDAGIAVEGGGANTFSNLLVKDNIGSGGGDYGDGIVLSSSSDNKILGSDVIHNGPFDGIAMFGPSSRNLIEDNVVGENNVPFTGDDGIRIEGPGAKDNVVRRNTVSGSTLDGIAIFSDQATGNLNSGNVITGNTVIANGYGFLGARPGDGIRTFLRANDNTITNNTVKDNAGSGILISSGSLNNVIRNNTALGNARQAAPASPRFDLQDGNLTPPCDANVWTNNRYGTANQACVTG